MESETGQIFQASTPKSRVDDNGPTDLSQVCTDFRYSLPENFHDMEIIGLKIVAILSSCGVREKSRKVGPGLRGTRRNVEITDLFTR